MSQISFDFTTSFAATRDTPAPTVDASDSDAFAERLQGAANEQSANVPSANDAEPTPTSDAGDTPPAEAADEGDNAGAIDAEAIDDSEQADAVDETTGEEPRDEAAEAELAADAQVVAVVAPVVIDEIATPIVVDSTGLPEVEALLSEGDGEESADSSANSAAELLDAELLTTTNQGEEEAPDAVEAELLATAVEQTDADGESTPDEAFVDEPAAVAEAEAGLDELTETDAAESSSSASRSTTTTDTGALPDANSDGVIEAARATSEQDADASGREGEASQQEFELDAALNPAQAGAASADTGEAQPNDDAPAETFDAAATSNADSDAAPATRDDNRTSQTLARIAAGRVDQQNANEPSGPRVDAARFVSRVAGAFQAAQERGGEVRIRLSPPELGALQVKITVADGVLNASLETENAAARNTILDNLPALRERLAEQDIRIEKFDVDVRDEGRGAGQDFSAEEQSERQARGEGRGRTRTGDAPGEADVPTVSQTTVSTDGQINLIA